MDKPMKLGFIGLGAMGYPMASQLISKSPKGSILHVYDVSENALQSFLNSHNKGSIVLCGSPREISTKAVCRTWLPPS